MKTNFIKKLSSSRYFFPLFAIITCLLIFAFIAKPTLLAVTTNFANEIFIVNLNEPTSITFDPQGRMFITERYGKIHVVQQNSTQPDPTPVLQITNINTDEGERGLVGMALDPNFASNGYYYVFYTANSPLRDRVSRFTLNGNVTVPGSELVIWEDIADAALWHHGGTVAFGSDGKLYISTGDGFDTNSGTNHVSQRLNSYRGKILRINSDGTIPSDNPFHDGAGANLDAIWARGLRNPFRFSFDSQTSKMLIGDVGGNSAVSSIEEINVGASGANYGWPICEGSCSTTGMTNPIFVDPHNGRDSSITGGFIYHGGNFPSEYQGSYFYGNYVQNWIRRLTFNANGSVNQNLNFEPDNGTSDGPYGEIVDLKQGPDGAIYYVDLGITWEQSSHPASVRRIKYVGSNLSPVITSATGSPLNGPGPQLTVNFSATATDPENDTLSYSWEFGDTGTSTVQNPTHTYTQKGQYTARLTVSDGTNQILSNPITIVVGTPPVATITTPINSSDFQAGDVIEYSGSATDADGTLTAANFSWRVALLHLSHTHPEQGPIDGVTSGTFTIPSSGHELNNETRFQFILTVTDSDGLTDSKSVIIDPEAVALNFVTNPPGLQLNFNQETGLTAPFVRNSLVNFTQTIEAISPQTQSGNTYEFVSWSDGGNRIHEITTPSSNQSYTAIFQQIQTQPTGLMSAYAFNESNGTVALDSTSANNNGTLINGPVRVTGKYSGGIGFDGTNDRVTAGSITLPTTFTMMAWVNNPSHQQYETIMTVGSDRDLYLASGKIAFWENSSEKSFGNAIPTNSWQHIALTYNGTQLQAYLNGQAQGSPQTISMGPSTGIVQAGAWIAGSNDVDFLSGSMDEVRIYNRALTQAEVVTSMNTSLDGGQTPLPTPTPTATPIATPTNTPTPTATATPSPTPTLIITSTPTPTSTPTSTPTVTPTPTATPTPGAFVGSALKFDGANDLVRGVNIPLSTQFTYEAWVKRTADSNGYETILGDANTSYNQAMFTIFVDGHGDDCSGVSDQFAYYQTNSGFVFCSGYVANLNAWHHLAVTRGSDGTMRYFIDGILRASSTSTPVATDSTGRLTIGRAGDYAGEYFPGVVDEVRISKVSLYTANFTPQTTSLTANANTVVLYHLNEATGQTVGDTSGNNRHATRGSSSSTETADPTWVAESPVSN